MSNYLNVSTTKLEPETKASIFSGSNSHKKVLELLASSWNEKIELLNPFEPDLIVLPEHCDGPEEHYGKEQSIDYFCETSTKRLEFWQHKAAELQCNIAYSSNIIDEEAMHNAIVMIDRNGKVRGKYFKNHPVIEETTEDSVVPGTNAPLIQMDFGTVGGLICFDLNFTELLERYVAAGPDMLIYTSLYHGGFVQQWWAYRCNAFMVASLGLGYRLPSCILSPVGSTIAEATCYNTSASARINLDSVVIHLNEREKLIKLKKKYGNKVTIFDPNWLGVAFVSSETDKVSAKVMAKELGIELCSDYFVRSSAFRDSVIVPANRKET